MVHSETGGNPFFLAREKLRAKDFGILEGILGFRIWIEFPGWCIIKLVTIPFWARETLCDVVSR